MFKKARNSNKMFIFKYSCFTRRNQVCVGVVCYVIDPLRELASYSRRPTCTVYLHFRVPLSYHVTVEILWSDCVCGLGIDKIRFASRTHPALYIPKTSRCLKLRTSCFWLCDKCGGRGVMWLSTQVNITNLNLLILFYLLLHYMFLPVCSPSGGYNKYIIVVTKCLDSHGSALVNFVIIH
jgi:hypothetical protein